MEKRFVNVGGNGVFTRVWEHGARTNLVFVHGLGASSRYWLPLCFWLMPAYNLYIPDLPGYGRSTKRHDAPSIKELAEVVGGFIEELGLRNVVLVGNSYGCQVIIELMHNRPALDVRKILLIGPTIYPRERSMLRQIRRWLEDGQYEPWWGIFILIADYSDTGWRRLVQTLREAVRDRPEDKIAGMRKPTLVIRGALDPTVPKRWAKRLRDGLPYGAYAEVRGAGHATHLNAARETAGAIRRFVEADAGKVWRGFVVMTMIVGMGWILRRRQRWRI